MESHDREGNNLLAVLELQTQVQLLELFGMGPRSLKRIINVFKVLKVIWKRDTISYKEDSEEEFHHMQRATLFLMLLASDESTREVTYMIFDWMEMGTVMYHHVAVPDDEDEQKNKNNLARLFKTELRKRDNNFELSFNKKQGTNLATTKQGTLMKSIEKYLTRYEWKSVEEWNKISSKFLLARCFSFFRRVAEDIDNENKWSTDD